MLSTVQEYKTRAASKSIAGGGRSKKQASDAASFRPYAELADLAGDRLLWLWTPASHVGG